MPHNRPRYARPERAPGARRAASGARTPRQAGVYRRVKLTAAEQAQRNDERAKIVAAVNVASLALGRSTTYKGMRRLQLCVRIARQHRLVSPGTFILAGFNPV